MINFFRRIRESLISKGKSATYIKYALGEIFLVMVGILLALQVNNWNQNKQRSSQEVTLLKQLRDDLNSTKNDVNGDLGLLILGQESHYKIRDLLLDKNSRYNDTLCFYFAWLATDDYLYPKTSTFEKLKEEGIDIIKNDYIKSKMLTAYEVVFPRISKANSFFPDIAEYYNDFYTANFKPNLNFDLKFTRMIGDIELNVPQFITVNNKKYPETFGFVPLNFENLKKDAAFAMLMKNAQRYRRYKLMRYDTASRLIDELIEAIDNYIEIEDD